MLNLGPRLPKYVKFSTYKLAIAKYNLSFKLVYNHLFIPLTFIRRHSVIQRRSHLIIPRMRAAIGLVQSKSFAYVGPYKIEQSLHLELLSIPVTYPAAEMT